MQLVNFDIDTGFTTINYQGNHFDLHNNFMFAHLYYDEVKKIADVIFTRGVGDWIPKANPAKLILSFKNVSDYYEKDHDFEYPAEFLEQEGSTVDMIGFSYDGEEIMDGVTDNKPNRDLPAMLFVFVIGRSMKIVADSVELFAE